MTKRKNKSVEQIIAEQKAENHKKGRSLFKKYYSSMATIVAVAMMFLGFWMIVVITYQWWNDKVDALKMNAKEIVSTIETDGIDFDDISVDKRKVMSNTLSIVENATNSNFFIVDAEGQVLICAESRSKYSNESNCENHSELKISNEHMKKALKEGFSEYLYSSEFQGRGIFILAVPVKLDGEVQGAVFATEPAIEGLVPYVLSMLQSSFIVTFITLLICFLFIYFLCKGITKPILEMKEATRHFAKGEFKYRAKEDYDIEYLNEFARSLNKMADELAVEDEAQKSFVANVSHELKTPMTSIGGFIDGIRDGTIPREKEMEYLDIVSSEVKRLARMVVSMLNLSKIESGEVGLNPTEYDVPAQIFETLLAFEKRINEKHVNIEGFEDMGQVKIVADRDLLQQVIYNLFDNAVKFVDDGGTISVSAVEETLGTRVTIRNSGKGVSNSEISRIFERFYKVDKSRSYDTKGVGLGLYIVKTIVNMHDGEISASSDEVKYTQFEFFIPFKHSKEE